MKPRSKVKKGNVFIFLMLLALILFYFNRDLISDSLKKAGINPDLNKEVIQGENDSSNNLTDEGEVIENEEDSRRLKPHERKGKNVGFTKDFHKRGKKKSNEK